MVYPSQKPSLMKGAASGREYPTARGEVPDGVARHGIDKIIDLANEVRTADNAGKSMNDGNQKKRLGELLRALLEILKVAPQLRGSSRCRKRKHGPRFASSSDRSTPTNIDQLDLRAYET
jgi:hypothetical protein